MEDTKISKKKDELLPGGNITGQGKRAFPFETPVLLPPF
jgi:hypothetical protein